MSDRRNVPSPPAVTPDEKLAEIKRLYYSATRASILYDLARAIDLLKSIPEEHRERAAVYMEGLAQMRAEWTTRKPGKSRR